MNSRKTRGPILLALLLLSGACAKDLQSYKAPSGNVLRLEILSAEQISPEEAKVSVCFELPSEGDWVLGRLLGDVALSDAHGATSMESFELLASSEGPPRRCDRLFFSRPGGFPPGEYTLTIARLSASIPAEPDWAALEKALAQAAPGLVIEQLPDQAGLAFGLISTPAGMTDSEAADLVVGLAEPVLIGPWSVPIEIQQ
jgi:hypothetical protein